MTGARESGPRRPPGPGGAITHWLLGETRERRWDVADRPMAGEMDPFFFLTKVKNFIPHEYPCRTEFALRRRLRRPDPWGGFAPSRVWLPFGSPRVDLSGFWFRPTLVGTWARTVLVAAAAGMARFRLRTCGGAVLYVDGSEAGWMAPYGRNLEAECEIAVPLREGANELRLWFDDLAERDARYYFELDFLDGPEVEQAPPFGAPAALADAVEAALDGLRFERPAYAAGEVALLFGRALPEAAGVAIRVEGDFMSIEPPLDLSRALPAGAVRLPVAQVSDLPADFRHFRVTLKVAGFAAGRTIGVELCPAERQGPAPATLSARVAEALDAAALHAEPDTVCALARLATGRTGPATEAMIEGALPAIEDCHDCADFILVPLLWARTVYGDALSTPLRARIDEAILGYRYWMDEPGNDVQWYFSENHALLFHTAAYLAGALLPAARFRRSGRLGAEQSATGAARVRAWLDHFEAWEMAEFNSAPYFPIDLKGLTALHALAPDADVRRRAGAGILRLLEIVARSAHRGILTGAQGRSYEHTLAAARSLELSGIARMLWGAGWYGRRMHALPLLALSLRDHGLDVPEALGAIAVLEAGGSQEWCFAQGANRIAKLYHHKTRDHAMGSAAAYRWNEWGYQETVLHLRLGPDPDAQVWINHPGETIHAGYGRPSFWGGSGTLPRVHQYRDLAVLVFDCAAGQPDFTHAWFPAAAFDESRVAGDLALARGGEGLAFLRTGGALELVAAGPTAGCEVRRAGQQAVWIVRLGSAARHGSLDSFAARFGGLAVSRLPEGVLRIDDPEYGPVLCHTDGRIEAEGRRIDPRDWTVTGEARNLPDGPLGPR